MTESNVSRQVQGALDWIERAALTVKTVKPAVVQPDVSIYAGDIEMVVGRRRQLADLVKSGEARRLRKENGLGLADIASFCGVNTSTVSNWETGRSRPTRYSTSRYLGLLQLLIDRREA